MNTNQHVARLEALLAKIRQNAVLPHVAAHAEPAPPITEIEEDDLEIDDADITDSDAPPSAPAIAATANTRAAATAGAAEIEIEVEEAPPQSSAHSRAVASSMEEALADLGLPLESQPPKPAGASAAAVALAVAALQLDEAEDLTLSARPNVPAVAENYAPTVELEEPFDAELELDDAPPPSIPDRSLVPGHQLAEPADHEVASLLPPASSVAPRAAATAAEPIAPAPEEPSPVSATTVRPPATEPVPPIAAAPPEGEDRESEQAAPIPLVKALPTVEPEPAAPELLSRHNADRSVQPLRYIRATREFQPRTFLELLDASLSLGSDRP
jgi:hypothetical protein